MFPNIFCINYLSLTLFYCLSFFTLSSFLVSCLDSLFCRVKLFSLCILIFSHEESLGIDQPTCFDMTHNFPVSNISTVSSFFLFPLCKLHTAEHSPTTSGFLIQPHSLTDYISFLALSTSFGLAYIVWLFGIVGPLFDCIHGREQRLVRVSRFERLNSVGVSPLMFCFFLFFKRIPLISLSSSFL
ncbi:uncharacterized protein AKAW2_80897A [Aspergillus luchuensis]|uniref:Uncharacterized protein n=1 Tax=Aspergillus kawachii TaxID=1069201 RepID=A0A7R7X8G6_ASPKA|nr:uncharacterized protein AKAW2_80897A [Aspergillus luchuensis]BCS05096.1 hypothetical protein AKAW2_80897A [Aspergillus luchuensis]BCS16654.1 hypothetical protein ALUC_80861A [Aspergillus luchuensis]